MVQVYFNYSRLWRPEGWKKFEWITNLHGVLHDNEWIMLHGLRDVMLGPSKGGESNAQLRTVTTKWTAIGFWIYYITTHPNLKICCGASTWTSLFFFTQSLTTHQLQNWVPIFHIMALEGCSRALKDLHGHGLLVCVQSNPNTVIAHPRLLVQTANERRVLAVVAANGSYPGHTGPLVGQLAGWGGQGWGRPRSPDVAPSHPGVPTWLMPMPVIILHLARVG